MSVSDQSPSPKKNWIRRLLVWTALGLLAAWTHALFVWGITLENYGDGRDRPPVAADHGDAWRLYRVFNANTPTEPLVASTRVLTEAGLPLSPPTVEGKAPPWRPPLSADEERAMPPITVLTIGYGWPAVAFASDFTHEYVGTSQTGRIYYHPRNGITTDESFAVNVWNGESPRVLPTRVVAGGLAINTACFALALGVLHLSVRGLRE